MRLIALPLCLALGACASDALRPTAVATMNLTQGFKKEMTAFAARQNVEIDAARRRIALDRQEAQVSAFRGAKQRMDWRSAKNEEALRLFDEATKPSSGPTLIGLISGSATPFSPSAVQPDAKQYDALLKALKPLAAKRTAMDDVRFLMTLSPIVDQLNDNMSEAAESGAGSDSSGSDSDDGN